MTDWLSFQPPAKTQTTPPPQPVDAGAAVQATRVTSRNTPWPTAEEEKLRLFNKAQAAVKKTQGFSSYSSPSTLARNDSDLNASGSGSQAIASTFATPTINTSSYSTAASTRSRAESASNNTPSPAKSSPKAPVPQYLTAEQEKAALKRYHEAKLAVDRTQKTIVESPPSSPIAYDSLYPSATPSGSNPKPEGSNMPPPFDTSADPPPHLSEKERLRRAYETQDAASVTRQTSLTTNGTPSFSPPPFSDDTAPGSSTQAISEKEMLRRKFEAQDAEMMVAPGMSPQPPPRKLSLSAQPGRPRPVPPAASGSSKVLSAAEEKALLRAKYNDEEPKARLNGGSPPTGTSTSASASSTPPAPPPLMPRPPVEYIQETQEEDARVSRFAMNGVLPPIDDEIIPNRAAAAVNLNIPTAAGFEDGLVKIPGPPPPLPPKPPSE